MTTPTRPDRVHHHVLETFVATGHAPTTTDIAAAHGVSEEEGRGLLHELAGTGLPIWLQPGTDLVASCAPFNEVPTSYRATIDGRPDWFAQCGFESVRADVVPSAPACADRRAVPALRRAAAARRPRRRPRGGEPQEMVCYVNLPFRDWAKNWPDT